MQETFHKNERLCSRTLIQQLFRAGKTFNSGPFRVHWGIRAGNSASPVQVMIAVPKGLVPKATGRNLVKRRIREAYRRNKQILYGPLNGAGRQITLIISYNTKETLTFEEIRHKIILLLQRLNEAVEKTSG
jgi:ribonuclease P protein component